MKKLRRDTDKTFWLEYEINNKSHGLSVSRIDATQLYSIDYKDTIILLSTELYKTLSL